MAELDLELNLMHNDAGCLESSQDVMLMAKARPRQICPDRGEPRQQAYDAEPRPRQAKNCLEAA